MQNEVESYLKERNAEFNTMSIKFNDITRIEISKIIQRYAVQNTTPKTTAVIIDKKSDLENDAEELFNKLNNKPPKNNNTNKRKQCEKVQLGECEFVGRGGEKC